VTNVQIFFRASSILRNVPAAAIAAFSSRMRRLALAPWIRAAAARRQAGLAVVGATIAACCMTDAAAEQVTFQSNGFLLHGCILLPQGRGPFPAIIFNHGSEKNPEPCGPPALASAYLKRGYIFFTFQRHGHGASPGPYIRDLQEEIRESNQDPKAKERQIVTLQEGHNLDVVGAVRWLQGRPEVDHSRVAMTGISFGGIQTLLAAEKGLGLRAFVAFAPAAQSWRNTQLQQRLITATRNARAPLFLAQAENDYSLGPSEVLGRIIRGKGFPSAAQVYPPFGTTPQQGHWVFATTAAGISIWGPDVFAFLGNAMGPIAPAGYRPP
jgi:carboxymethylenebutenolidase